MLNVCIVYSVKCVHLSGGFSIFTRNKLEIPAHEIGLGTKAANFSAMAAFHSQECSHRFSLIERASILTTTWRKTYLWCRIYCAILACLHVFEVLTICIWEPMNFGPNSQLYHECRPNWDFKCIFSSFVDISSESKNCCRSSNTVGRHEELSFAQIKRQWHMKSCTLRTNGHTLHLLPLKWTHCKMKEQKKDFQIYCLALYIRNEFVYLRSIYST